MGKYLKEIKAYNRARNEMLLKCDIDALLEFHKFHKLPVPSSRAMAEVTLHKTRTAVASLPMEERRKSKKWLLQRGFHALDDGDV